MALFLSRKECDEDMLLCKEKLTVVGELEKKPLKFEYNGMAQKGWRRRLEKDTRDFYR